ncbi:MFS general substrate transporter [Cucurbitaria berberidis CBS 394.84]|uniref:MFS general substrate transporter n=1 Tax=Cucurbitaria berberidis CBS 394.84 TaxID=1168544 RepID=A0A9P4GEW3_9PLEO|nr:MFS general substrate transporter [Cucurbitaria berberidis CBS 394.84]KAF1844216.1 MFS general substrate transporter [Cucurbitaria berberidis CBS 394.84]
MAAVYHEEKSTQLAASPQHTHHDPESGASSLSLDKDVAIGLVGEHAREIDPEVEARVLKKIDWFLIPAMIVGYGLVYYDKAILGSAVLFGMTKDLSLSVVDTSTKPPRTDTSRLSWATSLFYFGMLAGLYPMTFALQRFNLGRILGGVVLLWSLICMLTAAVTTHQGLFAQRFFLGFVESVIPTGFMCIISGYYTQDEQALRQSWWFSSTGLFTIIGGALNYAFAQITTGSLRRWQYIYLLAGCLTFLFGIWCFFIPNSPVSAWFLTPAERIVAVERLRKGQTGVRCQKIKISQLREAFLDIKLWLVFILMASAYTVNGAVSGFGPLIVSTFGWSSLESILWQFPLGGLCLIAILLCGYMSSRIPNIRLILLIVNCLPVIAGCAMIWKSKWTYHAATPVAGYSIIGTFGAVVSQTIVIGMSNVAGATKKSAMAAAIFVAYCVGNIVGPQLIKSQRKIDHYPELWTGLIICYCITILAAVALYFVLRRENKKRDAVPVNEEERDRFAFMDLTDKQNPYFRYVL